MNEKFNALAAENTALKEQIKALAARLDDFDAPVAPLFRKPAVRK